jgi:predicted transcriptional regulator with HTH domain
MVRSVIINVDGEHKEAMLVEDKGFLGGWKVEYENAIISINLVEVVDDFGFKDYKTKEDEGTNNS